MLTLSSSSHCSLGGPLGDVGSGEIGGASKGISCSHEIAARDKLVQFYKTETFKTVCE